MRSASSSLYGPGIPPAPTARQRRSSLAHTRGASKYPGCRIACCCTRGSVGLPPLRGLPRLKRCGVPSQTEPEPASCQGHLHRTARGRRSTAPGSSPLWPALLGFGVPSPTAPRATCKRTCSADVLFTGATSIKRYGPPSKGAQSQRRILPPGAAVRPGWRGAMSGLDELLTADDVAELLHVPALHRQRLRATRRAAQHQARPARAVRSLRRRRRDRTTAPGPHSDAP